MLIALALVVILAVCGIAIAAAAGVVIHGTVTKNKFGVNLDPSRCARCHNAVPSVRVPKSLRQALWGGWTCPNCGCEMDKWGREI